MCLVRKYTHTSAPPHRDSPRVFFHCASSSRRGGVVRASLLLAPIADLPAPPPLRSGMLPAARVAKLQACSHYPSTAWSREGESWRERERQGRLGARPRKARSPHAGGCSPNGLILPVREEIATASGLDGCAWSVMAMACAGRPAAAPGRRGHGLPCCCCWAVVAMALACPAVAA